MQHGVTFFSAKVCSPAIFETSFSYDKRWMDYCNFYIIMLFPLTGILQLIDTPQFLLTQTKKEA